MGGGLMQLVAYGAQDIYLTGNPQITFFKVVYRRHTNFSMESIKQTFNGTSSFSGTPTVAAHTSTRCTATISRNGDLVHRMYLEVTCENGLGGTFKDVYNPGAYIINSVELEIGGQKIDKQTGDWMETWAELTEFNPTGEVATAGPFGGVDAIIGGTLFQRMSSMGGFDANGEGASISDRTGPIFDDNYNMIIPLQFWFCRNPGLSIPLIALQYHELKIILDHRLDTVTKGDISLWCDYIYLDTDERRRFAQVSHEYLIEQVQEQSASNLLNGAELNFNHPVKELIWIESGMDKSGVGGRGDHLGLTYVLMLNGHERFEKRSKEYFTRTQIWQHHTGCGGLFCEGDTIRSGKFNNSIAVYSFALKPEEHQPSGTCNFSRIDNAILKSEGGGGTQTAIIYAVNYNILRIMSGMGGLAYSN